MNELLSLKKGIWYTGNTAWLFGLCDRTVVALADQYLSAIDIIQLGTASLLFVAWLFLYPIDNGKGNGRTHTYRKGSPR